jgi:hypothetical protein
MKYGTCDHCSRFYLGPEPDDPAPAPSCRCCGGSLRPCSIQEVRAHFPTQPTSRANSTLLAETDDEIG